MIYYFSFLNLKYVFSNNFYCIWTNLYFSYSLFWTVSLKKKVELLIGILIPIIFVNCLHYLQWFICVSPKIMYFLVISFHKKTRRNYFPNKIASLNKIKYNAFNIDKLLMSLKFYYKKYEGFVHKNGKL